MSEQETSIHAVYVEHDADKCPADKAYDMDHTATVVTNLENAQATGVFIPPHHKGVSLVEGMDPTAAKEAHADILPRHQDPEVVEVGDDFIRSVVENPSLLDDDATKRQLLEVLSAHFPGKGLDAPVHDQEIPVKNLRELPGFIAEKTELER